MSPELTRIKKEIDDYNAMVELLKPFDIHQLSKPDIYTTDNVLSVTFFVMGHPDTTEEVSINKFFESYLNGSYKSKAYMTRLNIMHPSDTLTIKKEDIALLFICKNTPTDLLNYAPSCLKLYSFYYIISQVNVLLPQDELFLMPPAKVLTQEEWDQTSFDTWYDEFTTSVSKNKVHIFKTFFSLAGAFRVLNEKVKSITQSHEDSKKMVEKQRNDVSSSTFMQETPLIEVKNKINSRLASYERMVKDHLNEVFAVPSGHINKKIEGIIDQKLDELIENKQAKNIALTIPLEIHNEINALFLDAVSL